MAAEQTKRDTEAKAKMEWQRQPFLTLNGHTSCVYCVAWSPKGDHLASASGDKTIVVGKRKDGLSEEQFKKLRVLLSDIASAGGRAPPSDDVTDLDTLLEKGSSDLKEFKRKYARSEEIKVGKMVMERMIFFFFF